MTGTAQFQQRFAPQRYPTSCPRPRCFVCQQRGEEYCTHCYRCGSGELPCRLKSIQKTTKHCKRDPFKQGSVVPEREGVTRSVKVSIKCINCGEKQKNQRFKQCSVCKTALSCSRECQGATGQNIKKIENHSHTLNQKHKKHIHASLQLTIKETF